MHTKHLHLLAILSLLTIASGCSDDGSSKDPKVPASSSCETNDNCTDGRVCHSGQCLIEVELGADCSAPDSFCKTGSCNEGICKDTTPTETDECSTSDDCGEKKVCAGNKCVEGECTENSQCGENKVCSNDYHCIDDGCSKNDDCKDDKICKNNECIAPKCTDNSQCETGKICKENECVTDTKCTDNSQCTNEQICRDGTCVTPECTDNSQCGDHQMCKDNRCIDAECLNDDECEGEKICQEKECIDPECINNDDCSNSQICNNNQCVTPECSTNDECTDGKICEDIHCVTPECTGNDECRDGKICEDNHCATPECTGNDECSDDKVCEANHCITPECQSDGDCEENNVCPAYHCVPRECTESADCSDEKMCKGGICIENKCTQDANCSNDERCGKDLKCHLPNAAEGDDCTDSSDCEKNTWCDDTLKCVPQHNLGEACTSDIACIDEEVCKIKDIAAGKACGEFMLCDTSLKCIEDVCRNVANPGDPCDELHYCTDGFVCETQDDKTICVKAPETCNEDADCGSEKICTDNLCTKAECLQSIDCPEDKFCRAGRCTYYIQPGTICTVDEECPDNEKCGSDNRCHDAKSAPGETCSDSSLCLGDYYCKEGLCVPKLDLGTACSTNNECKGEYVCFDKCTQVNVGLGGHCGENIQCESSMTCLDNICKASINPEDPCDALHLCPNGYICFTQAGVGKCVDDLGGCTSDSDCGSDTYCCTDAKCENQHVCMHYGEGPRGDINYACTYKTVPGLFEAAIQCEWKSPAAGDAYPNHANVLMTPLVMNTPHASGTAQEIIFTTYNNTDGGAPSGQGSDIRYYGVIRIINAETCELHESIFDDMNHIIGGSNIAMADVDNDGYAEIFAGRGSAQNTGATTGGGIVAFHWDNAAKKYKTWWNTTQHSGSTTNWGGPSIYDINNDGIPEIIGYGGEVFNTRTGARINVGQTLSELSYTSATGDFDSDGNVEIAGTSGIYRWNNSTSKWEKFATKAASTGIHPAYADFGMRKSDGTFDTNTLDGIAEVVSCGSGIVQISTIQGETILRVTGLSGGGPCTIGDFDGDGLPEVATAFGDSYRIFDPRCKSAADGCAQQYILWAKTSQDASSSSTGSSLFDFDGDGAMEAVYADECYTRVYDGKTGDVLFSAYRSSATWHEYPVIADVDNDESAEIVVGSNNTMSCKSPDPIHRGLRCATDSDCKSGLCKAGLCRCTSNAQCNWRTDANGNILNEYGCVAPIAPDSAADGNVCRAIRNNSERVTGVRVMKDSLDRWMSSRNIWNQHAYNITNINDNQTVPKTSNWVQNFITAGLNNFRQNMQGSSGPNKAPDITGRFVGNTCEQHEDYAVLGAEICNRGTKMVAKLMPASFYKVNDDSSRTHLCTSYTTANVPVGGCLHVECQIPKGIQGTVVLVANDDGKGGKTTVECNEDNNEDTTTIQYCIVN